MSSCDPDHSFSRNILVCLGFGTCIRMDCDFDYVYRGFDRGDGSDCGGRSQFRFHLNLMYQHPTGASDALVACSKETGSGSDRADLLAFFSGGGDKRKAKPQARCNPAARTGVLLLGAAARACTTSAGPPVDHGDPPQGRAHSRRLHPSEALWGARP